MAQRLLISLGSQPASPRDLGQGLSETEPWAEPDLGLALGFYFACFLGGDLGSLVPQ